MSVYGYCPKCGAEGVMREKRFDGNDTCDNGCTYPSKDATDYREFYKSGVMLEYEQITGCESLTVCGDTGVHYKSEAYIDWLEEQFIKYGGNSNKQLRDVFRSELTCSSPVEMLLMDNNASYITWLEAKLGVIDIRHTCTSNVDSSAELDDLRKDLIFQLNTPDEIDWSYFLETTIKAKLQADSEGRNMEDK